MERGGQKRTREEVDDPPYRAIRSDPTGPTPRHEKDQRRAARAAVAANERSAGLASSLQHYTPALDKGSLEQEAGLDEKFVWQKKITQQREKGLTDADLARIERERKDAAQYELEKLAKRRLEREAIQRSREEDKKRLQREKDLKEMGDVQAKEEEYHLETAKERAMVRIRDGRAHPIDAFVLNMALAEEPEKFLENARWQMGPPDRILTHCSDAEVEELYHECHFFVGAEKRPHSVEAWQVMRTLSDQEMARRREKKQMTREVVSDMVAEEMEELLRDQTYNELCELEEHIEERLKSDDPGDVEYWEELLRRTASHRAKTKIRILHERAMVKHVQNLLQAIKALGHRAEAEENLKQDATGRLDRLKKLEEAIKQLEGVYRKATGTEVEEASAPDKTEEDEETQRTKMFTLEEDEEVFKTEVATTTHYHWKDKYRPRKPKYFNRVQAGFEWNKYNMVHYDHDNPPPKIVQGYKFNIFYPDLIDKSKTPHYTILKDGDSSDTCILVFKAGPPYEDVAFRIVKREWEHAHRRGFRCSFDRGVLQLHFNFKKVIYRR